MIKLEKTEVLNWEAAIRGMRNPKNSWAKSDSRICPGNNCDTCDWWRLDESLCDCNHLEGEFIIGPNDHKLMMQLAKAGTDHAKYRRQIIVSVDITAPLYWWKEFDTYKVGTVANSCSTMHKIHAKEFMMDDFSYDRMTRMSIDNLDLTIEILNGYRHLYVNWDCISDYIKSLWLAGAELSETGEYEKKMAWDQMIQLLPSSYNQKRTVTMNYENLANMYKSRKNHKLEEWHVLCDWIKGLPYSEIITLEEKDV